MLKVMLGRLGHDVETFGNGREALERLQVATYDLLIVDIKMPEMDGPAFFQALSTSVPELRSRIIFVTGDTVNPATYQYLDQSQRPVLTKPFTTEALNATVSRALTDKATI